MNDMPKDLGRRAVLKGAAAVPVAPSLAAVLASPALAEAAASTLETVTIETPSGRSVSASLALPRTAPAPAVMLIHEWWGLNNQIKAVAAEYAAAGYAALAIDLYDGSLTDDPAVARTLVQSVDAQAGAETTTAWIEWLRAHDRTTEKLGTVGWCFGGGWSLNASLAAPVDATVIYYGNVAKSAAELASLKGPVLGHFATEDQYINQDMVTGFEAAMAEADKPLTVHWYEANHAFANPTGARYDEEDAQLAWSRTQAFFEANLKD